ncbi:DUF3545 family protein [Pseudidiomarina salinarum]|uniref:DUF3545 family protein n=1 Tax=Pseudidiomarina salinarum TaxID=435908 RepID=UPI0009FFA31B|nr:DUF3545 family protein [Pseudidiomarina salinarum]RUO70937.1 DUF3545 domain-containing protein [Pseudidiomarina salinarum]
MDHSDELSQNESKADKASAGKRKWREIEAIKEKYRLRQELQEMDFGLDLELDQLEY